MSELPANHKKKDGKKMTLVEKSRHMAYEEPSKEISEAQFKVNKRLVDMKKKYQKQHVSVSPKEEEERIKHAKLIGQLKAAEARSRLRAMRLRYQAIKAQEISHLIACQPVALKAVRLQALVPPQPEYRDKGDLLNRFERQRVEALLEDAYGHMTNRVT